MPSSEEQAIEPANDTPFGLAAGLWTEDLRRAHRVTDRLRTGNVWVNTYKAMHWALPFGGHKQSGNGGSANGSTALHEWMAPKAIWMNAADTSCRLPPAGGPEEGGGAFSNTPRRVRAPLGLIEPADVHGTVKRLYWAEGNR